MIDVVDKVTRSRMMSGIRGKNTKPEIMVRKVLHRRGFRFRIHASELTGSPDIVFPKYDALIFVHGCFWHGHMCKYFKWPDKQNFFWNEKISGNKKRDVKTVRVLKSEGWRIAIVWECVTRLPADKFDKRMKSVELWILSQSGFREFRA